jgi:hypothetical protein
MITMTLRCRPNGALQRHRHITSQRITTLVCASQNLTPSLGNNHSGAPRSCEAHAWRLEYGNTITITLLCFLLSIQCRRGENTALLFWRRHSPIRTSLAAVIVTPQQSSRRPRDQSTLGEGSARRPIPHNNTPYHTYHTIPHNTTQHHTTPHNTRPCHRIPQNPTQYHTIPHNTTQYHTCSRVRHFPNPHFSP